MRFTLDGTTFELSPAMVRTRLAGRVPEPIREYWVEIDGTRWPVKQVIALATGVSDRQRFQSRSARRWLQNLGFTIGRSLHHDAASVSSPADVISRLQDPEEATPIRDIIATGGVDLRVPGMYSWWVDEAGANDLTTGLGNRIQPGLVYAGLAGATRSGGSASSNTLWGRIATMHLGKRNEFSTLRRSLGSVLAEAQDQPAIDEEELTRWMHEHLRVTPIPVDDPDTLDGLESEVLAALDPPLNLAKVPKTPLRTRLSALRKKYASRPA